MDSGACCTILGAGALKFIQENNLTTYPSKTIVETADGTAHSALYYVNLPLTVNNKTKTISTMVVPSLTKPLILGMDFWELFNVKPVICNQVNSLNLVDIQQSDLSEIDKERLQKVIDLFPILKPGEPLPRTSVFTHEIDTGDAKPIKQRYYPVSPYIQKEIDEELQRMLALKVIRPSISPWSSPMVITRKKPSNKIRMCLDSRALNRVSKPKAYPLPYISRILGRLRSTKFLSTIDLKDAFWQIPLEESSKEKTAFTICGRGLFEFEVLPFGLSNSAQTQCQVVDAVLGYDMEPNVFSYMDDIICATDTFEEHLKCLEQIALRLRKGNLTVSVEKSKFCQKELKYLGFILSETGINVDPERVRAILEFPSPKNVKGVRSILGMFEWYRRFIVNFSIKAAPITDLLKKTNSKFKWTEEAESAFNLLKTALTSAPILATPDFDLKFTIQTDACDEGMGAVLTQVQDGCERVIEYMSQKFSSAQKKYSTTEKECLAVILAVEKYRCYIEGVHFEVITDHASLKWLHNLKDPVGRLARWALRLQAYNFTLSYRKGNLNVVPDALSRSVGTLDLLGDDFTLDPDYVNLKNKILSDPISYPNFSVQDNVIYKNVNSRALHGFSWKVFVPANLRSSLLKTNHDDPKASHGGIAKTLARIKTQHYWPSMGKDIKDYVRKCEICQVTKYPSITMRHEMGQKKEVTRPWEMVSIDLIGPLPRSKKGNTYCLVIIDVFTKFTLLHPINKPTSNKIIQFLEEQVFLMYGVPYVAIQDNGSQFISKNYKKLLADYDVKPWFVASYHPQPNSVERMNRTVKTAIRAYVSSDHREWDIQLPQIGCAIRTALHQSTKFTPYFLNFGQEMVTSGINHIVTDKLTTLTKNPSDRLENLTKVRKQVTENLAKAYESYSKRYNLRSRTIVFKPGDIVLKRNFKLSDAVKNYSAGLGQTFVKCKIKERIGKSCYRLENLDGKDIGVFSVKDLNVFHY